MNLKGLREFLNNLPAEMDEFEIMNGEVGYLENTDDNVKYRLDKPVIMAYVDRETKEVCLFHQTQEEIEKFNNE